MITKLRLKNWKSHLDSQFEFSKGVNALLGIMGSGKSSVVQGISFALFGKFPGIQSIKMDEVIMGKPNKKDFAEVELEFIIDGNNYSVKRRIAKGKSEAEIRKGGGLITTGPVNVTESVEKLLQIDYDLFSKAVYSEQNGIDFFLRIPSGRRREQIDRMLKLDEFERVRELSVSSANRLKNRIEEKMRIVSELEKERIEEKLAVLERELVQFRDRSMVIGKELEKVKDSIKKLNERLEEFEEMEKKINSLKTEKKSIEAGLKEMNSFVSSTGVLADVKKRVRELDAMIKGLRTEEKSMDSLLEEFRTRVASKNAEIRMINESIKNIEGVEGKCPVCDTKITREKKLEIVSKKTASLKRMRVELNKMVAELERIKEKLKGISEKLRAAELEKEKAESSVAELERLDEMKKRRAGYLKKLAELKNEIAGIEKKIKLADVSGISEQLENALKKEGGLAAEMKVLMARIKEKEESIEDVRKRKGILDKYREEISCDGNVIKLLESFCGVLVRTQDQLRDEFLKLVNSIMSSIWSELYPYGDFTDIRLWVENDFILQLRALNGEWLSVEGIVSGGERSMAALALRIAFSLAFIPKLGWLILDEPTHNLDSNAIGRFAELLREKIGRFTEQVFLITHEERLVEGIVGKVYRLEREKEKDGVTISSVI